MQSPESEKIQQELSATILAKNKTEVAYWKWCQHVSSQCYKFKATGNCQEINRTAYLLAQQPPSRPAHLAGRPAAHPPAKLPDQTTHQTAPPHRPSAYLSVCLPAC